MKQRCVSEQFIAINDNLENACQGFYIKWKDGEREQDSRETVRMCVRGRALQQEEDCVVNKIAHWRKTYGANVRLISGVIKNVANDVVPMIRICSVLVYK